MHRRLSKARKQKAERKKATAEVPSKSDTPAVCRTNPVTANSQAAAASALAASKQKDSTGVEGLHHSDSPQGKENKLEDVPTARVDVAATHTTLMNEVRRAGITRCCHTCSVTLCTGCVVDGVRSPAVRSCVMHAVQPFGTSSGVDRGASACRTQMSSGL